MGFSPCGKKKASVWGANLRRLRTEVRLADMFQALFPDILRLFELYISHGSHLMDVPFL